MGHSGVDYVRDRVRNKPIRVVFGFAYILDGLVLHKDTFVALTPFNKGVLLLPVTFWFGSRIHAAVRPALFVTIVPRICENTSDAS